MCVCLLQHGSVVGEIHVSILVYKCVYGCFFRYFLERISNINGELTKMTSSNLALVISPNMFHENQKQGLDSEVCLPQGTHKKYCDWWLIAVEGYAGALPAP